MSSDYSTFLKDSIGPLLSEGIAATCIAQPADPVEFLAHWLNHHVHLNSNIYPKRKEFLQQVETQRAQHEKESKQRQDQAAQIIQLKVKQQQKQQKEIQEKQDKIMADYQSELKEIQRQVDEDELDPDEDEEEEAEGEDAPEQTGEGEQQDEETAEEVTELRVDILANQKRLKSIQQALSRLDEQQAFTPSLKTPLRSNEDGEPIPPEEPSTQLVQVLKAIQILLDRPKNQLKQWYPDIRRFIPLQTKEFLRHLTLLDPTVNQRRLKFRRAKQILASIESSIENASPITQLLYDYVKYCVQIRKSSIKLATLLKKEQEAIPEDASDPQTDSEKEYVDSDDERPDTAGEDGGEEADGEGEEEEDE